MENPESHLSKKAIKDYKLLIEAKQGNQKAFERILKRYKDAIFYTLLEKTKNYTDAEELTYEALLKAFTNLHQYSEKYSFSTWLFKIAENTCRDFFRKKKKEMLSVDKLQKTIEKSDFISLNESVSSPEERIIEKQQLDKMKIEMEKLNEKYKMLIKLRYFREYTYKEIAEELDIPIGTVKTQLHRAKKMLLRNIQNNAID